MKHKVDFINIAVTGLESSPFSDKLAGLRANEARYFMNKYKIEFEVSPVKESKQIIKWVNKILKEERNIEILSTPLETAEIFVENIKWIFVFYESGLAINVLYTLDNPKKCAVGFKLSEGMDVPKELEGKFKFARQKSKLAGIIRGSFFIIKGEY
ncbi:MAG: hypothetical protein PHY69_10310 [Dysgonamonadaceae bacterium]|nr:hypothetical protein [Dysgonamonadaceae bacterium]